VFHGRLITPRGFNQKSSQGLRTKPTRRILSISLAKTVGKQNNHLKNQVANGDNSYDLMDRLS